METITVNVPTSLMDITLQQFQRLSALKEDDQDIKTRAYCSIVYSMPGGVVDRTPKAVLNNLVNSVDVILNSEPKFVNRFTLDGLEYGFIPELERMTAGEWVDMETFGFDPENLHKLMAIFYRPISESKGDKYLILPYSGDEITEKFKNTPAGIILGALLFFSRIVLDCMLCIPNLSEKTQTLHTNGGTLAGVGVGTAR
jgi:hypothetical protein